MPAGFVHLHVHSEYSLVDSTIRIPTKPDKGLADKADRPNLISRAVELGMPAIALTDTANLFALVKFYRAAERAGIKPIIGCDLWIANAEDPGRPSRLTVLCRDRGGYLDLARLVSRAHVENRHGDFALIEPAWLDERGSGLIALAGPDSDIGRLVVEGRDDAALERTNTWRRRFADGFYLEAVRTNRAHEDSFLHGALDIASRLDLPIVASNDVRFLERADFEAHEARVCIQQGRVLADPRRPRDYSPDQYLKSADEMQALFADLPALIENAGNIAERCNLELQFGQHYLPAFPVPETHTLDSWIRSEAAEGLANRLARHTPAPDRSETDYAERLERELEVIVQMGFPGYFLIVADFINWAKRNGIPVGPGRGSGAGSLVAWALGITDIDPLRYDLLFERFLNPERVSLPDFDIDFCMERRDRVIDYVAGAYGHDRVSQIITYGSMAAKAVLRDTGRVLSMPYGQVDRIAKMIPLRPADPVTLQDALGRSARAIEDSRHTVGEFRAAYEEEEEVRELIDLALKLEDLIRNAGKHAGGVVIAPGPLSDYAPLYCESGGDGVVTQFDKDDVETVGLVKFDFLGLRTLTIIDWSIKAINARRAAVGKEPLDVAELPLDDADTYRLFARGDTVAIFQFESRGMRELLTRALPNRFEDLIALVSLYRPGPMDLIPDYVERKHGRQALDYADPRLAPILDPTYGVMVYQEQVMQIAQSLGGYTLGGADLLRRAMGKKQPAEMAKQRVIFTEGAHVNGIAARAANTIFDQMEKFAGYGFNKSHAAAYALVAYQTAWIKVHYPSEFMAAVLSADMDSTEKVVNFLDEIRSMGLRVLPPNVNASGHHFEVLADGSLQYGLGAVKGVGRGAVEALVRARETDGPFSDLADFCRRVDGHKLNKRVLEALILSGAMDGLAGDRATLMEQLPDASRAAEQHARNAQAGQHDMFGSVPAAIPPSAQISVEPWPLDRLLAGERATLGHYLSGHPTDAWAELIARVTTCSIGDIDKHCKPPGGEPRGRRNGPPCTLAGMVVSIRKRGDSMAFVQVEDASGRLEVSLYREAWLEYGPLLTPDAILVFEGNLATDDYSGGFQLRAQRISTIEDVCARDARLLRIELNGMEPDFRSQLEGVLGDHRGGTTPVHLGLRNANGSVEIELGEDWQVRASPDLTRALENLVGVASVQLVYGRPYLAN